MQISSRLGALGMGFALVLLGSSSPAAAGPITITSVVVTIGATTYNSGNVGWTFPVTLNTGQDLVLTQDYHGTPDTVNNYNFDTSDGAGAIPSISVTANGVTTVFSDTGQILNVKNQGSVPTNLNEAQVYSAPFIGPGFLLFLGYADNTHPDACGAYATSLGLAGSSTCFPSPFSGASFFQGTAGVNPGLAQTLPNHCANDGSATCYEGGVLRIVATEQVPEPATMTLLLTGFAGLAARRYRQGRKRRSGAPTD